MLHTRAIFYRYTYVSAVFMNTIVARHDEKQKRQFRVRTWQVEDLILVADIEHLAGRTNGHASRRTVRVDMRPAHGQVHVYSDSRFD